MSKVLVVPNADFSLVAVDTITHIPVSVKTYLFNPTSVQEIAENVTIGPVSLNISFFQWNLCPYRTIKGVRLIGSTDGDITIEVYKKTQSSTEDGPVVDTIYVPRQTSSNTFIDVDFSEPIALGENECIGLKSIVKTYSVLYNPNGLTIDGVQCWSNSASNHDVVNTMLIYNPYWIVE